jgi:F0F1-type ATP synthase membrane subunit c/vacuolar-type H+-ATPase subunit K
MEDSTNGKESQGQKAKKKGAWIGLGLALGVAFGAAMDNVGLGIALGICFGAALEAGRSRRDKD